MKGAASILERILAAPFMIRGAESIGEDDVT
jgi:hypothetical protein